MPGTTKQRPRNEIMFDLKAATERRIHAGEAGDFDAYQHLCEFIDDLLIELYKIKWPPA